MRKSLTLLCIGAALAVLASNSGCTKIHDEVPYCSPADESWNWLQRSGSMRIDLERGWVYWSDTGAGIYAFDTGNLVGFEGGFPLLLFNNSVHPSELEEDIVVGNILFRVRPVEGSFGNLWLITAKPRESRSQGAPQENSTVLYSTTDGVLSIGFVALHGDKVYLSNYVPCGRRTLRYEDLRSFADAAD